MTWCRSSTNIDIKLLYNKDYTCNRISEIAYCRVLKFNTYTCTIAKTFPPKKFVMFYGMAFWFDKC